MAGDTTRGGQCLCGAVTFTAHGDPVEIDACHCGICRRQCGGSAYIAAQFKGGVTLKTADTLCWYKGSEWGERGFCSTCGTAVGWRLQQFPDKIGISVGTLNETSGLKLDTHIFTDSGPDYYDIPHDVPHKTGDQVMAEFMERMNNDAAPQIAPKAESE